MQPHHYGQINAPLTNAEWKAGFAASPHEANYPSTSGASFISKACTTRPSSLQASTP